MKICEVIGCNKSAKARGFCSAHYSQLRRTGNPTGSLKIKESIEPDGFIPYTPLDPETKCSIEGCDNLILSRGWCNTHYLRWQNHGDPGIILPKDLPKNLCSKCEINERYISPRGVVDSHCVSCRNIRAKEWRTAKGGSKFIRYGLSKEDIELILKQQKNSCAICNTSFEGMPHNSIHIDHDNGCCSKEITRARRSCGKCVRSILCGSCNQGLGNFKDNTERLMNAINYLRKWGIE